MSADPAVEPGTRVRFLQRRYRTRLRRPRGVVGAVPLVDFALLLIAFLLLHSRVLLTPGVPLELPSAEFLDGARLGHCVVTLTREGLYFFDDERLSRARLAERMRAAAADRTDPVLVIEADRRLAHEVLLQVYAMAREAGYQRVYLATRAPEQGGVVRE